MCCSALGEVTAETDSSHPLAGTPRSSQHLPEDSLDCRDLGTGFREQVSGMGAGPAHLFPSCSETGAWDLTVQAFSPECSGPYLPHLLLDTWPVTSGLTPGFCLYIFFVSILGSHPVVLQGSCVVLNIESRSTTCKANVELLCCLFLFPPTHTGILELAVP